MRRIRSKDTLPEIMVRALLRSLGHTGYRLNRRDLPGSPDIAWIGRKLAIFVNGCFWHGHDCKHGARVPATNRGYWARKIERNCVRDAQQICALQGCGWRTLVLWECQLADMQKVARRLDRFLLPQSSSFT